MDKILISTVADLEQLMETLNKGLPSLLRTQPIDAVIIDSVVLCVGAPIYLCHIDSPQAYVFV